MGNECDVPGCDAEAAVRGAVIAEGMQPMSLCERCEWWAEVTKGLIADAIDDLQPENTSQR